MRLPTTTQNLSFSGCISFWTKPTVLNRVLLSDLLQLPQPHLWPPSLTQQTPATFYLFEFQSSADPLQVLLPAWNAASPTFPTKFLPIFRSWFKLYFFSGHLEIIEFMLLYTLNSTLFLSIIKCVKNYSQRSVIIITCVKSLSLWIISSMRTETVWGLFYVLLPAFSIGNIVGP